MLPNYLHLKPGQNPPALAIQPYKVIIVAEDEAPSVWRGTIAEWIYSIGSRYVIAWGESCTAWHDDVDWANLKAFDFGPVPDEEHAMTTWHDDEPISEVFWFAGYCAHHPDVELSETVILHIAKNEDREAMLLKYRDSQDADIED